MALRKSASAGKAAKPESAAPETEAVESATITVTRHFENGDIAGESPGTIEVRNFATKPATVSVGLGASLAEYGAAKVSVMVTVPCYTEELDDAKSFALSKAKAYLDELAAESGVVAGDDEETETADDTEEEVDVNLDTADRDALIEYAESAGIEIDLDDYPDTKAGLKKLRAAIIAAAAEADEEDEDEATGEEGGDDITEEDINAMSADELVAFIEENELETDPKEYKVKTAKGLKELKAAVIAEVFAESDYEEAEEDEAEEDDDADEGDEDEAPDFASMDRDELVEYIDDNELDVDVDTFADNARGLKNLRTAVADAYAAAAEEGGDEDKEEEESDGYTKEELDAMDEDELKAIFKENGMKYPSAASIKDEKVRKKRAIKMILDAQADEG